MLPGLVARPKRRRRRLEEVSNVCAQKCAKRRSVTHAVFNFCRRHSRLCQRTPPARRTEYGVSHTERAAAAVVGRRSSCGECINKLIQSRTSTCKHKHARHMDKHAHTLTCTRTHTHTIFCRWYIEWTQTCQSNTHTHAQI